MKVSQVYQVVNSIQSQLFGSSAVAVTNTTGLRALGEQLSASNLYDKFVGALVDRIGKTVIRTLDTRVEFPGLLRNEFEFGAMLCKVNFDIPAAENNSAWDISNPGFTPDQFDVKLPSVKVIYFKNVSTFRIMVTIPDEPLLNSAFKDATEMAAFVTGISDSMEKSMVEKLNAISLSAISAMIAEKADANSASYLDLLTVYNSLIPTPVTADEFLKSPEALRWASAQIDMIISYLDTPSELYNDGFPDGTKVARRTTRDNMHVWIHSQYAQAAKSYMQADTFWKELVSTAGDNYKEVKMWQGSGTSVIPSPADTMTIHVITESGDDVECPYVFACFADREAIAVTKYNLKSAAARNDIDGYTNLATIFNGSYAVDLSENVVVFGLGAPTITPPSP